MPQRLAFVSLLITLAEAIPVLGPWSLLVLALLVLAISLLARPFDAHVARGLIVALFTLATLSHSAPAWTSDAVADEPVEQRVKRQLIVLFDPTRIDSPRAADIVSAVNAGRESAELTQLLGSPQRAKRLLDRVPAASASFLSTHDPLAPRAVLESYVVLTYPTEAAAFAARSALRADERVLSVERNGLFYYSAGAPVSPNDTYYAFNSSRPYAGAYQWGMELLNMPNGWNRSRGSAYLAALDNGIYCLSGPPCVTHVDIQDNLRSHFSINVGAAGMNNDLSEYVRLPASQGHGTHVAGIVAAKGNNATGVSGVCWNCSLSVLKFEGTWDDAPAALLFAADHGIQAVNMSFGDYYSGRQPGDPRFASCNDSQYQAMCQAIAYAKDRDVVLIAASGNGRENRIQFPAIHQDTIAVGGVQIGGAIWTSGYGNPGPCPAAPQQYDECGSNFGQQLDGGLQVVAPALDVISAFYPGATWNANVRCADTWGPAQGVLASGYGDCTGTSQAAPHVAGLVGLIRSTDPLLSRSQVKSIITSTARPCTPADSRCGAGIPDAAGAMTKALGGPAAINRLTPLFSFHSAIANDHFYTVVPQMALAALNAGQLLPQPPSASIAYVPIGTLVPNYNSFPVPSNCFSPCPSSLTPRAIVSVFTTHVDPTTEATPLVPLYRMSWKCVGSCSHVSHFYTTDPNGVAAYKGIGYEVDGIEGYVFPTTKAQPFGTVKLCRKYAPLPRDDYVLFAGTGPGGLTCGVTDGFTRDAGGNLIQDYSSTVGGTDFIGWAYPVRSAEPVYAVGFLPAILFD